MDYDLKKKRLQNESPSDIKIRNRGMDDENPNRCIKASITPKLIINQQGCLAATAHIPAKKKKVLNTSSFHSVANIMGH